MPTSLTGNKISQTYPQIIHVDGGVTGTAKALYDGDGTATVLKVSTSEVEISGNLTIAGTLTNVNTTNLQVDDSLIQLGRDNNSSDVVDIGFVGLYDAGGTDKYAGLFRDANDSGKFKLFIDSQEDLSTTNTINTSATGYTVATLVANLEAATVNIDGGNIDGTTIATSDITVGTGKTLNVSGGTLTLANDQISGDAINGGTIGSITISQLAGALDANNQAITNVDINSGAIDGTNIGANSAGTGAFTTLTASGDVNFDSNTLFVDASESKVGIGGSPASGTDDPLQVITPASGGGQGISFNRNDNNASQLIGRIIAGNSVDAELASMTFNTDGANDSGNIIFNTEVTGGSLTERLRIESNGAFRIGGDGSDQTTKWHSGSAYVNAKLDVRQLAIAFSGTDKVTSDTSGLFTFKENLTIASTGVNAAPSLAIDNSSNASYIHSAEMFGANLGAGNNNILVIGKSGDAKRSGWMGYKLVSDSESNDNLLVFGHFGTTELMSINGAGKQTISANNDGDYGLFVNNGHATGWGLRVAAGADNGDYIIRGQNENGDEKFIVTSAGEVGINRIPQSSFEFDMIPTSGNANFRMAATATNQGSRMSLQAHSGDKNQIEFCDSSDQAQKGAIDSTVSTGEMVISATGDIKLSCGGSNSVYSLGAGGTTNTAFGKGAGSALNSSSNYNVFLGFEAGKSATSAQSNIVIGYRALDAVTSQGSGSDGSYNIALGTNALTSLTNGHENIVIGDSAGLNMTSTSDCVLIGSGAGLAINHTDANGTVAIGQQALRHLTEGNKNLAIGFQALHDVAGGDGNMGIGYQAGASLGRTEFDNIAIGTRAMLSLMENATSSSVDNNIAIGIDAMTGGELGSSGQFLRNIAIGNSALKSTGSHGNTGLMAIGYEALKNNTSGAGNHAIGYLAGQNVATGSENTLYGYNAGQAMVGSKNTFVGYQAGVSCNGTGDTRNTCIGNAAGDNITSGTNNTILGSESDTSAAGGTNQIVIGYGVVGQGDNYAVIGNGSTTRLYIGDDQGGQLFAGTSTINTSDKRIKKDIQDSDLGLDFINKLRPVNYKKREVAEYDDSLKKKMSWYKNNTTPRVLEKEQKEKTRVGFIAQEVGKVLKDLGFADNNEIIEIDKDTTQQGLAYERFVPALVKAVQELSQKVEQLQKTCKDCC